MMQARFLELGISGVSLLFISMAVAIGLQVSALTGLTFFVIATFGFMSLFFNFDYPLVRRLAKADDQVMFNLCRTGFVGRSRRLLGRLPASPRCRFCFVPFGGIGKLIGIRPFPKNPNYCRSCFEGLPTQTHEMEIGVLFADIRGFTSWAETHATGDAPRVLTRFYELANRVLTSDDVFVEFVGDQVMALYLVEMPSLGERTPEVMLAAAKRLVAEIRKADDALPVGVGLNFGFAQVGPIAKGEAKDFTAVGDVVNTAARLQSSAQEFEIVLSESVYTHVAEKVTAARPTSWEVKGKAERVKAFVISGGAE